MASPSVKQKDAVLLTGFKKPCIKSAQGYQILRRKGCRKEEVVPDSTSSLRFVLH